MKFSFLTYQFARYPLEYCFYMAKEYGFNGIEVWGARPHAYAYDMDNTMIRQVIDWKKKYGIEISMFTPADTFFHTDSAFHSPAEKTE